MNRVSLIFALGAGVFATTASPAFAEAGPTYGQRSRLASEFKGDREFMTLDVKTVSVREIGRSFAKPASYETLEAPERVIGNVVINPEQGSWSVFRGVESDGSALPEAGKGSAAALPYGVRKWRQLRGWRASEVRHFRVVGRNLYGVVVLEAEYSIRTLFAGGHEGVGGYLARTEVIPTFLRVVPGFRYSMSVDAMNVYNAGTKEAPLGALVIQVKNAVSSSFGSKPWKDTFHLRGDGAFVRQRAPANKVDGRVSPIPAVGDGEDPSCLIKHVATEWSNPQCADR